MWPPPNFRSLPSKKEIQRASEEISTIELDIIETELRLDALRKSLFERRAWIAPIRKVPHEILSLIFIEASITDWKAPLVLQRVCRRWRNVVVDSPEAWTFIPLSKCSSESRSELISLFLERSRKTPLHISVGNDSFFQYTGILANRVKCIHLKPITRVLLNRYLQHGHMFHQLERLAIWHSDSDEDTPTADVPVAWDMLSFPNLKFLNIKSRSSSLVRAISAAPEFPAIRHLTVASLDISGALDILTKCATSLESAGLIYLNRQSDREYNIHLPRLKYLRLVDLSNEAETRFRFKAATPNLQAYHEKGSVSTTKVDTGSVILLHAVRTPDLSRYPRLVTLCFTGTAREDGEVIRAIECLRDNPALCPNLALVEYTKGLAQEQVAKAKEALMARGDVTGHVIQLKEGIRDVQERRMQAFRGVKECGGHMPCKFPI